MTTIKLEEDLLDGLENFIADRDQPPRGKMSYDDAVNIAVRDWLMSQGYLALPDDPDTIVTAFDAAEVPR
nr:hypothetical protein [uncultured Devosia sp.]